MNKVFSVFCALLLISYNFSDAREINVKRVAVSSAYKVDVDWSIYGGVTYISSTGAWAPVNIEFTGAPLNAGISLQLSVSNKFFTFPLKLGFDAGFSHATYGISEYNLDDLKGSDRVRKSLHIDRLPMSVYLQTNSTMIYGIGFYDKMLLSGSVEENRYTLGLLNDTCFQKHIYGVEFRMGAQFDRFRYVCFMSVGFAGEFDEQKIAQLNRSYAQVDTDISGGIRFSYLIGSNYSPKRKMRFLFKYE